jgi:hypothetical protein
MANSNSIQNNCRFKIAEAREKIFKLSENTWAGYSISTISTNQVCPAANDLTAMQIQSGDIGVSDPESFYCLVNGLLVLVVEQLCDFSGPVHSFDLDLYSF